VIERVCVIGAGSIGSLFAGHLAQLVEVTVLTRREDHAEALNRDGLRVTGRSDLHARHVRPQRPADRSLPGAVAGRVGAVSGIHPEWQELMLNRSPHSQDRLGGTVTGRVSALRLVDASALRVHL